MEKEIKETRENIEIKILVENILDEIGVKISLKGYRLWSTAVKIKMSYEDIQMMDLYREVAKKHKTTASKVERAMRGAYEDIKPKVQEYFHIDYIPSNKVFLEYLTRKVELFVKQKKTSKERSFRM